MKSLRPCLLSLLLLAGGTPALPAGPVKDLDVLEFPYMHRNPDGTREKGYEYAFGDWDDKRVVQIPDKGLLVNLVGSKGGVGDSRGLDFRKHNRARISFIIGNRNQAESFTFSLVDADGTDQMWSVPLKDQPKGMPAGVLLDLTKPTHEDKPGRKPGLDLKKIEVWQIKGNYQDLPIEILFLKVTAVSE